MGVICGTGLLLKTYSDIKDYKKKIELCRFAYTTYEKLLLDLRTCLRAGKYDNDILVNKIIIDMCPSI